MKEVDPFSLTTELFDEVYLPEKDCWKHHYSVLRVKQKRKLEPLLEQAGIVIKTELFDEEEDAIILRNWNEVKDDLGFEEGNDARMFVGFGKKMNPDEVSECVNRARDANFNKRICEGLQHRFLKSVRARFELLFDPKRLNLQRNKTPYELSLTPGNVGHVKKDGKICKMNEDELNQVFTAMNETEGTREATLALQESLGVQWITEYIENQIRRLGALSDSPLEKDKWNHFYKTFLKKLVLVEKKSELELIDLLEDGEYDWKGKAPWLTVALSKGVKHCKKYLVRAWSKMIEKIRRVIAKFRENGRPFVVFLLFECVLLEEGFDEWRAEQEREWGKEMEETEAREAYEKVLIQLESHLILCQRKRNGRRQNEHHEICRFENGQLVRLDGPSEETLVDKEDLPSDDDDDDGPLQDPVVLSPKEQSLCEERPSEDEEIEGLNQDLGETQVVQDANENEEREVEPANGEGGGEELIDIPAESLDDIELPIGDIQDEDVQLEKKKKKKKKRSIESAENGEHDGDQFTDNRAELLDDNEQPIGDIEYEDAQLEKKKKKKKKRSIESAENGEHDGVESVESKKKRKKEKRRLSEIETTETAEGDETTETIPPEVSSPKKKKKKRVEEEEVAEMEETAKEESGEVAEESPKKKKKKKKRRSSNGIIEQ